MSDIKVYTDPSAFWQEVAPHLRGDETRNSLCLGVSYALQNVPENCLYQSALFDGAELEGACLVCQNSESKSLLPSPVGSKEAAKALLEKLEATGVPYDCLIGDEATVAIYQQLLEATGRKTSVAMGQGVYSCSRVAMPKNPQGLGMRPATAADADLVARWVEGFGQDALPPDLRANAAEYTQALLATTGVFLLERDGEAISMAAPVRDIGTSCGITLIYTPKALRQHGYASLLTAMLTQHFLDAGKREVSLFTDLANPTSNSIYKKIGYEFIGNATHLRVEAP